MDAIAPVGANTAPPTSALTAIPSFQFLFVRFIFMQSTGESKIELAKLGHCSVDKLNSISHSYEMQCVTGTPYRIVVSTVKGSLFEFHCWRSQIERLRQVYFT
ncbi:hypothetical protein [Brevibacterium linens]|uniref:hypothetical protein n=1 Tax=Brevibacterium linens TaxID=1703 RepID=UPI0013DF3486|nr:hypothetical protein [Brevibacterium linens]